MASNSTVHTLPNPNTPLVFLPPILAEELEVSSYVAFVWDWIMSMPEEYEILRKSTFRTLDVTYVLSQLVASNMLGIVAPVRNCQTLLYILGSCAGFCLSFTSLLFLYRVRAVYSQSKIVRGFFNLLWVVMARSSVLVPLSLEGEHLGPTNRCIQTGIHTFGYATTIINTSYDTLVFIAISCQIIAYTTYGDDWRARARSFYTAGGLPKISKALLQGGQLYYSATIGLNIVFAIMLISPSVPVLYRPILSIPNLALENTMACRVHRAVKLGLIKNFSGTQFEISTLSSGTRDNTGNEFTLKNRNLNGPTNLQVNVDIATTTDSNIHVSGKAFLGEESSDADGMV
ncbi:hypothetical protein PILCRDRAFT_70458 [Piloderma croceum F 1598]|uniref:Uncharacterized protein n=1 Tax=Piloderma croceum (strain F 1598) TaxID=765440 RepID=A0A0C3B8Z9_PILCF|nr:hypothetical protein PILCRDRAFT_70458 [Piloderma croceum F 1598]